MSTLFNLTDKYKALVDMASEDDPAFKDTLESVIGEIEVKADDYAYVITAIDNQIEAVEKEEKRIKAIKDSLKNNKKAMNERLLIAMKTLGKTEISTDLHRFKVVNNGGVKPFKMDETDINKIPDKYKKTEVVVDTEAIKKDLDAGIELTIAHYEDRGQRVSIK